MSAITLEVILSEIKRIELVHSAEFTHLKTEISDMKTEISGIKTEIGGMKTELSEIKIRLGRVEEDVRVIRDQTAHLTEVKVDHERRIRKLEGPSA